MLLALRDSKVGLRRTALPRAHQASCGSIYYGRPATRGRASAIRARRIRRRCARAYAENLVDLDGAARANREEKLTMPIYTAATSERRPTLDLRRVHRRLGRRRRGGRRSGSRRGQDASSCSRTAASTPATASICTERNMFAAALSGGRRPRDGRPEHGDRAGPRGRRHAPSINWTTCFRTPERVMDHWAEHHGVEGLTHDALVPHWERIETRLNVVKMRLEQVEPEQHGHLARPRGARLAQGSPEPQRQELRAHRLLRHGLPDRREAEHARHDHPRGGPRRRRRLRQRVGRAHRARRASRARRSSRGCGSRAPIGSTGRHPHGAREGHGALGRRASTRRRSCCARASIRNGRTGMRTFLHPAVGGVGVHEERIEPVRRLARSTCTRTSSSIAAGKDGLPARGSARSSR